MQNIQDLNLCIKLNYSEPVDFNAFVNHIDGIGKLFQFHNKDKKYSLYLKEVQKGSIVTILTISTLGAMLNDPNTIITFFKYVKDIIEYWVKGINREEKVTTKKAVKNTVQVVSDYANNLNFSVNDTHGNVYNNCSFTLDRSTAKQIKKNVDESLLKDNYCDPKEKVFFKWSTANIDNHHKKLDRVVVSSIDDKARPVSFDEIEDKKFCLAFDGLENKMFKADIKVILTDGKIVAYNVIRVYKNLENDIIDISDQEV